MRRKLWTWSPEIYERNRRAGYTGGDCPMVSSKGTPCTGGRGHRGSHTVKPKETK